MDIKDSIRKILVAVLILVLIIIGSISIQLQRRHSQAIAYILQGDELYKNGQYAEALTAYQQARDIEPSNDVDVRIQQTHDAIDAIARTVGAPRPERLVSAPELRFEEAADQIKGWLRAGKFQEANNFLEQHVQERTKNRNGYFYAASILISLFSNANAEDMTDLLPKLNTWIEHDSSNALSYVLRGRYYSRAGSHIRGMRHFSHVPKEEWEAYMKYLRLAEADFQTAAKLAPDNPLPLLFLISISEGRTAERYIQQALDIEPDNMAVLAYRINFLQPSWGGSEDAMFAFARATYEQAPRGSAQICVLALAHELKGRKILKDAGTYFNQPEVWAEVSGIYRQLIEYFPHSGYWPTDYAIFLRDAGRLEDARTYYDLALARDGCFEVRFQRGEFLKDYALEAYNAEREFEAALQFQPYNVNALSGLADARFDRQKWSQAQAIYAQLVELDPTSAYHYRNRAATLFNQQQYRDAIDDYTRAIALKPDLAEAYRARASAYEQLGMTAEQRDDLRTYKSLTSTTRSP